MRDMARKISWLVPAFGAVIAAGTALAQMPPMAGPGGTPTPPAADAAAPAATGMINSVNVNSLKAVFDAAGVQAEIVKEANGFSYVSTTLFSAPVVAVPMDCANGDQTGDCKVIFVESGQWNAKMPSAKLAEFNRDLRFSHMISYEEGGEPALRYVVSVGQGVSPDFVLGTFANFAGDLQDFVKFAQAQQTSKPGFASATDSKGLVSLGDRLGSFVSKQDGVKLTP